MKNESKGLKNWHNAGMSSSWGSVLFGKRQNENRDVQNDSGGPGLHGIGKRKSGEETGPEGSG